MALSICSVLTKISVFQRGLLHVKPTANIIVNQVRGRQRWIRPYLQELYRRRLEQGPEPERHRSAWINWNYDAEIFAFGQRLNEDFKDSTLRQIFTHRSYIEKQRESQEDIALPVDDNTEFIEKGVELSSTYIKGYLRHSYPALPEEAICDVCDYLMSEEMLSEIGSKLGVKDLILTAEFPVTTATTRDSLMSVIGGLNHDQGRERAEVFIQDMILTMLIGKDVMEIWQLANPMGTLQSIVTQQGRADVESRLLFEAGASTVLASYSVGVYSDKQLLGKGYGETVTIAEEMAARDALRNFMGTTLHRKPLPFGSEGHKLNIDVNKINNSVKDFLSPSQLQ